MGPQKGIDDLPDEILVEIFSYLTFEELVHSVQYVTSRWQEVTHDAQLWRHLAYSPSWRESDGQIASVLQQTPKLQTLILSQRGVRSTVLNTFMESCPNLKRLEFNNYQRLSTSLLERIVQKCPNIEHLSIPNGVLSRKDQAEIIGQFTNLRVLDVGGWADPDNPVFLRPLAEGCPALQSIDLKDKMHTNDDLEYLLQKKKNQLHTLCVRWSSEEGKCTLPLLPICQTLKTLHVDSYCDTNIEAGFESLRSLKTVTSLTLCFLNNANINYVISIFNKKAMMQLVELHISYYENYEDRLAEVIVKNCPRLKHLCIKECSSLTDDSVENFHTLKDLQKVNLYGSNITDKGVVHISKCKHLKYLNLKCCIKLSEKSMELITRFTELQVLKLDFCDISGLPIGLIPSRLKNLRLFSVNYCKNVDQEALKQLKEQMPHLCIYDRVDRYISVDMDDWESVEVIQPVEMEEPDIIFIDAPFILEQLGIY
ncbi:hypothetical protein R5R35_001731 [Gryllus longicercus]|uniref:F-box domain-containing protein n=1 Tax=Gryllus longicercus TaxID=2509291 RepID=A0AAN9VYA5_9ORTH